MSTPVRYWDGLNEFIVKKFRELPKKQSSKYWLCKNELELHDWSTMNLELKLTEVWGVYTEEQSGYKTALEKIQYYYEDKSN